MPLYLQASLSYLNSNHDKNGQLNNEELMRKMLANQRTIIEQNARIFRQQEQDKNNMDLTRKSLNVMQVPSVVRVSTT